MRILQRFDFNFRLAESRRVSIYRGRWQARWEDRQQRIDGTINHDASGVSGGGTGQIGYSDKPVISGDPSDSNQSELRSGRAVLRARSLIKDQTVRNRQH